MSQMSESGWNARWTVWGTYRLRGYTGLGDFGSAARNAAAQPVASENGIVRAARRAVTTLNSL